MARGRVAPTVPEGAWPSRSHILPHERRIEGERVSMPTYGWSGGYPVDIGYIYEYYPEIDPRRVNLSLLRAGFEAPEIRTACELGFGQGVSVVVHGTAGAARWWGNDFMPSQVAGAMALADAGGAPITLTEDTFAELAARDDLPMFDYVALHGVWSWVSQANRASIVEFLRRRLVPGGVVYVSYNVRAGWASHATLRTLLKQYVDRQTPVGMPVPGRIDAGFDFVARVLAGRPQDAADSPMTTGIEKFRSQNGRYLAHEFLNDDWSAFDFTDVVRDLAEAKLTYAVSANLLDTIPTIGLRPHQAAILDAIGDPILTEAARDVMVDQMFRRDVFLRGPRRLSPARRAERIRDLRLILVRPFAKVFGKIASARGSGLLQKDFYLGLIEGLADLMPHRLGDLFDRTAAAGTTLEQTFEAICVLVVMGDVALVQSDSEIATARPRTAALNADLLDGARGGSEINTLASPVTGGGIESDPIERLFLEACLRGEAAPRTCAEWALARLAGLDRAHVHEHVVTAEDEQNLAELNRRAEMFLADRYPQLLNLGVVA